MPTTEAQQAETPTRGRVLVVDDDDGIRRSFRRSLRSAGFFVEEAGEGSSAVARVPGGNFDVILSDIDMPGMDGIALLRAVRELDLDVPVVFITGTPRVETAVQALEHGACRYLTKPVGEHELVQSIERAVQLRRMATWRRQALSHLGVEGAPGFDRAGLEAGFLRAIDGLWIAFQPVVRWSAGKLFGHEALVRSREPSLPNPGAILHAAERLDRLIELGRKIRTGVASHLPALPLDGCVLVNLHPSDLDDPDLVSRDSPLGAHASRIILEITERASLDHVSNARRQVAMLRELGYRIAIDDLGAGYAGLTSVAQLEPEVVKLDMSLVRNIDVEPTKQRLVRSMIDLCRDMGIEIIVEGVETVSERDTLVSLGADLLQGYLFGRPAAIPTP